MFARLCPQLLLQVWFVTGGFFTSAGISVHFAGLWILMTVFTPLSNTSQAYQSILPEREYRRPQALPSISLVVKPISNIPFLAPLKHPDTLRWNPESFALEHPCNSKLEEQMATPSHADHEAIQSQLRNDVYLPCVVRVFSRKDHTPFVEWDVLKALQSKFPHCADPGLRTAIQEQLTFHANILRWWQLEEHLMPDHPAMGERILPCKTPAFLVDYYHTFNRLFFQYQLPPTISLEWTTSLWPPSFLGRTLRNSMGWPYKILIYRPFKKNEYLAGDDFVRTLSTLLHEMCHVYLAINICLCHLCSSLEPALGLAHGRTGHGKSFLYLAWLVERAANDILSDLGTFDLGLEQSRRIEDAARIGYDPTFWFNLLPDEDIQLMVDGFLTHSSTGQCGAGSIR